MTSCPYALPSLRIAAAAALLALCACASAPAPRPAAPEDGEVLARGPCPVAADVATFSAEVKEYLQADMEQAGLAAELAVRPVTTLYPPADHARLKEAAAQGRCERVLYRVGALRVAGFVLQPVAGTQGTHPVLLWLRGGNAGEGAIGSLALVHMLDFADAGFVVVATKYRGVDGGDGADEVGGADLADVHALVPLARHVPGADVSRLYLVGGSRGAMEGLMAVRAGLPVRAAVLRSGMYDVQASLTERPMLEQGVFAKRVPGWATDREAQIARRSAVRWAGELHVPLLLLHGEQDWRVSLAQSTRFAEALRQAGTPYELLVFPRDEHQLALHRREWVQATTDWFRRHGAFDPAQAHPVTAPR
jgi:acetyl esterase/lipase